jgi:hypothetical protein
MELAALLESVYRVERKEDKLIVYGERQVGETTGRVVAKVVPLPRATESRVASSRFKTREAYEAAVYMRVINPMVRARECANLVTGVGWMPRQPAADVVAAVEDVISDQAQELPDDSLEALAGFASDSASRPLALASRPVSVLVTRVPANLVGDLDAVFPAYRDDWRVPFQMGYTLTACDEAGLSHNDNHLGNWLVSTAAPEVWYAVAEDALVPVSGVRVWLFDWDLAYAAPLGDNPYLDERFCASSGACNGVDGLHDLALMACVLDHAASPAPCVTKPPQPAMWQALADAVCTSATPSHPCHVPRGRLVRPPGVDSALQYVLELPDVAAQVVSTWDMAPEQAAALLGGRAPWVAHRGIDRERLVFNLRAASGAAASGVPRVTGGRKRPLDTPGTGAEINSVAVVGPVVKRRKWGE